MLGIKSISEQNQIRREAIAKPVSSILWPSRWSFANAGEISKTLLPQLMVIADRKGRMAHPGHYH